MSAMVSSSSRGALTRFRLPLRAHRGLDGQRPRSFTPRRPGRQSPCALGGRAATADTGHMTTRSPDPPATSGEEGTAAAGGAGDGDLVAWFADLSRRDVGRVGGKGANLGELTRAGFPVPAGFVVTAGAYLRAIDESGVRAALQDEVAAADVDDPAALADVARRLQDLVRSTPLPEAVRRAVH